MFHAHVCPDCGSDDITECRGRDRRRHHRNRPHLPRLRHRVAGGLRRGLEHPAMTGQTRRHLHAPLRPALPARQALRRLDRRSPRPARPARLRARRTAGGRHLARRDRLHPGPHLRRHPPHRTRHQERRRRGPVLPGLHPPAAQRPLGRRCPPTSPPAPISTSPEGGNPMSSNRGSGRNQRNNPYQLDELFVKFHRTPAGIAWRWRTELAILTIITGRRVWRLDTWITLIWAGRHPGRARRRGLGRAALPPVHHPARSGASWPATASSGCATKPGCTPAPGGCR